MSSEPERDTPVRQGAQPRHSHFSTVTPSHSNARRLLTDQLGLIAGDRLLVLFGDGSGLQHALHVIEQVANEIGALFTALDTRELSLTNEVERRVRREALSRCDACVLLGGEGRPAAERFESEIRVETHGKPLAILRVDPDALLERGLFSPTLEQRACARHVASRLVSGALVTIRWYGDPPLSLRVEQNRAVAPRAPVADFEFPVGLVAVGLDTATGQLARPTSILLPAPSLVTRPPDAYQFHNGILRAVMGPKGADWLGEASRRFPGMRLRTLGFGTISPEVSPVERAGVRLSDVGCSLSVVDARQRGVAAGAAAYTGLTFCLNGPGLDVDIDGTAILRGGHYVQPSVAY